MSSQKIDCGHKTLAEAVWDERGIYDDRKLVLHVSLVFPVCLQILPAPQTQALAPLFPNILQLLIFAVVKDCGLPSYQSPLSHPFSGVPFVYAICSSITSLRLPSNC